MYRQILVALDGTEGARLALDEALKIASMSNASVIALYVVTHAVTVGDAATGCNEEKVFSAFAHESAMEELARADELFTRHNVRGTSQSIDTYGESIATILLENVESSGADLMVMGTHGRAGIERFFLGSVAESVLRQIRVPLLLVRSSEQPDEDSTQRHPVLRDIQARGD